MNLDHGKFIITVDDDIITVKSIGAFNTESAVKSIEELKFVVGSFCQKKFKLLFDHTEYEGATPAVFEEINECNIWLSKQNLVAKAIVITSSINLNILESRTSTKSEKNTKNFDNMQSANDWLQRQ